MAIGGQAGIAILLQGFPALGPELQRRFGLTTGQTGALLTAAQIGVVATLFAWGLLADRRGERVVMAVGLLGGGATVLLMPLATSVVAFGALLFVAAALAAAANAGGGRAVMSSFAARERAMALSLRQTATPLGAAAATAATPPLLALGGIGAVTIAIGVYIVAAGIAAAVVLRTPPDLPRAEDAAPSAPSPLRDRSLLRLALGSALLSAVQLCIVTYSILFLTSEHDLALGAAAGTVVLMQVAGAAARVVGGRWSDRTLERVAPLRRVALVISAGSIATALAAQAPTALAIAAILVTGIAAICWNGLGVTAAGELAGAHQAGAAIGLYITALVMGATVGPLLFGLCVGWSWPAAFALTALPPLIAWRVLAPLDDRRALRPASARLR